MYLNPARASLYSVVLWWVMSIVKAQNLINGESESSNICYATTGHTHIFTETFSTPPVGRVVVYDQFSIAPMITIDCIDIISVFEGTSSANSVTCDFPNTVYLCSASSYESAVWACEELEQYTYVNAIQVQGGSPNGPNQAWKLEIELGASYSSCYPIDVQVIFTAYTSANSNSINVTLLVFVSILVFLVLLCFLALLYIMLRKALRKRRERGEDAIGGPKVTTSEAGSPRPHTIDLGEYPPQPLPLSEVQQMFMMSPRGEDYNISHGHLIGPKYLTDDRLREHTSASALPVDPQTSVYAMTLQNDAQRDTNNGIKDPVQPWSPLDHPEALAPPTVVPLSVLESAFHTPRHTFLH